jgi:hypothetical protein
VLQEFEDRRDDHGRTVVAAHAVDRQCNRHSGLHHIMKRPDVRTSGRVG